MISDPQFSPFISVGMGLALGLLVGMQRGWVLRTQADGSRFAGIRTFALMGLAGGLAGVLYDHARGPAVTLMAGVCVIVVLGYERASRRNGTISGTSSMVALLTLASGFLVGGGERLLGTAVAVVMVLILTMRDQLHHWVEKLTEREVLSIARFAVIALVVLPLLPDQPYGPYDAWNPRKLWLIVVLVSGFSFAGYFAARVLGPTKGIIATAAAGSVVSSTAVTASLATKMKEGSASTAILAAGISTASVVMGLRVLIMSAVLAPFAFPTLARLVVPGIVVSLGFSLWYLRLGRHANGAPTSHEVEMRNPFDLAPALVLTALVMVLTIAAHWVLERFGDHGVALVLAISGTVDVDSAVITLGTLPSGTMSPQVGGLVLAVPTMLNTGFKGLVAVSVGGWEKGRHGLIPLFACALAIVAAGLVVFL